MRFGLLFVLAVSLASCAKEPEPRDMARRCAGQGSAPGRMILLPGGAFPKGFEPLYPEELPTVTLHVAPLEVLSHEVTNDEFAAFVAATSYVTDAERSSAAGGPGAGSALFEHPRNGMAGHWRLARDATWRSPEGAGSSIKGRGRYPVAHVSLRDARRYAAWAGGRLPTEVEWEYAAWSGLRDRADPLSGTTDAAGKAGANIWHGVFPLQDTADDGVAGLAPVGCFAPDRNGAYDLIGNVWEWTETPAGAGAHVIKGGSFLCAANYCRRYRAAAREDQEDDFSANHIGFRIVRDPESRGAQFGQ